MDKIGCEDQLTMVVDDRLDLALPEGNNGSNGWHALRYEHECRNNSFFKACHVHPDSKCAYTQHTIYKQQSFQHQYPMAMYTLVCYNWAQHLGNAMLPTSIQDTQASNTMTGRTCLVPIHF